MRGVVGTCGRNLKPSRKKGHQRHTCRRVETWPPFAVRFLRRSRYDNLGICILIADIYKRYSSFS